MAYITLGRIDEEENQPGSSRYEIPPADQEGFQIQDLPRYQTPASAPKTPAPAPSARQPVRQPSQTPTSAPKTLARQPQSKTISSGSMGQKQFSPATAKSSFVFPVVAIGLLGLVFLVKRAK